MTRYKRPVMEECMLQQVIELEKVLLEEKELYEEVFSLEQKKSSAIETRNGSELETISREQESRLERLENLDTLRQEIVDRYVMDNRIRDINSDVTLKEVLGSMDEDSSRHLMRIGFELKNLLVKLNSLKDSNQQMIGDNMRFFELLVSGIKDDATMSSGYGRKGMAEEKVSSAVLINQRA
jgi:hypothetical protein